MKFITPAIATALALAAAGPAIAQAPAAAAAPQRQLKVSPKAQPAIFALQTAVKAKNSAAIPGLLSAAQAAAKTPDDRYAIGTMQLQAAIDTNDYPGLVAAADTMNANGGTIADTGKIYLFAAQRMSAANQIAPATAALDKLTALDPNNGDALLLRSELLFQQKRVPESLNSLTQAITRAKAAGQPVPESWYQARVGRAYDAKMPAVYGYSREWVAAAPSAVHWRDTINIYRNMSGLERQQLIDMMRLARATKALSGESDYAAWASSLINHGYPSEGLALLQEGAASGSIRLTSPSIAPLVTVARAKSPGEKALLTAAGKNAPSAATAKPAMLAADGFFDAGDYAQAASLYRTALTKPGVDKDLANLRLGMALSMSGDKAGAATALQSVGGTQAEVAKYWMVYTTGRA